MNRDINRLEHMLDACERISEFTDVAFEVYEASVEKQAAVASRARNCAHGAPRYLTIISVFFAGGDSKHPRSTMHFFLSLYS